MSGVTRLDHAELMGDLLFRSSEVGDVAAAQDVDLSNVEACYQPLVVVLARYGFFQGESVEGRMIELCKTGGSGNTARLHLQRWDASQVRAMSHKRSMLLSTEMGSGTVQAVTLTLNSLSLLIFCPWPQGDDPGLVCRWTLAALRELCEDDRLKKLGGATTVLC